MTRLWIQKTLIASQLQKFMVLVLVQSDPFPHRLMVL